MHHILIVVSADIPRRRECGCSVIPTEDKVIGDVTFGNHWWVVSKQCNVS